MDSFWFQYIVSASLGILTGLGVGGGNILILLLQNTASFSPAELRAICMAFFLPCGMLSTFISLKNRRIRFKKIILPILFGSICAVGAFFITRQMDKTILTGLYDVYLLLAGIYELKSGFTASDKPDTPPE